MRNTYGIYPTSGPGNSRSATYSKAVAQQIGKAFAEVAPVSLQPVAASARRGQGVQHDARVLAREVVLREDGRRSCYLTLGHDGHLSTKSVNTLYNNYTHRGLAQVDGNKIAPTPKLVQFPCCAKRHPNVIKALRLQLLQLHQQRRQLLPRSQLDDICMARGSVMEMSWRALATNRQRTLPSLKLQEPKM
jgi:hypothetical protein